MNTQKTVLVISDTPDQFIAAASMLRQDGYCVRFENDLSETLTLAGPVVVPNLIISELAAPDLDGLQLCREVRNRRSISKTPILLVGDLSRQSPIVLDGFRCGASGYLQKPFEPSKLAKVCRSILSTSIDEAEVPGKRFTLDAAFNGKTVHAAMINNTERGLAIFSASGELIECNTTLKQLLDYSEKELYSMPLSEFIFPSDMKNAERALSEVIGGTRPLYEFENGYLGPSGERIWGNLTVLSIPDNGSHYLLCIFDDPTIQDLEPSRTPSKRSRVSVPTHNSAIFSLDPWKIDNELIFQN